MEKTNIQNYVNKLNDKTHNTTTTTAIYILFILFAIILYTLRKRQQHQILLIQAPQQQIPALCAHKHQQIPQVKRQAQEVHSSQQGPEQQQSRYNLRKRN